MMGTKRTSNSIGIKQYDFDFKKEKKIYSYLHGNKRKHKGLDDEYKFVDYSEWKKYIQDKYKEYSSQKLICFSRYLSQKIRNVKPNKKYWDIVIPIMIALLIEEIIDKVLEFQIDFTEFSLIEGIVVVPLVAVIIILTAVVCVYYIVIPLWENSEEESLLTDYKEIIDEMAEEKIKEEKKAKKQKDKESKKKEANHH